jgi:hypothetical protein
VPREAAPRAGGRARTPLCWGGRPHRLAAGHHALVGRAEATRSCRRGGSCACAAEPGGDVWLGRAAGRRALAARPQVVLGEGGGNVSGGCAQDVREWAVAAGRMAPTRLGLGAHACEGEATGGPQLGRAAARRGGPGGARAPGGPRRRGAEQGWAARGRPRGEGCWVGCALGCWALAGRARGETGWASAVGWAARPSWAERRRGCWAGFVFPILFVSHLPYSFSFLSV